MLLILTSRLLELMRSEKTNIELKIECASVLGSLAKGCEQNNRILVDAGCIGTLLQGKNGFGIKSMIMLYMFG